MAQRGTPVRLTLTNQLPPIHPLPVDTSLPGAELPPARPSTCTAVIRHGSATEGRFPGSVPTAPTGRARFRRRICGMPASGTFNYYYPNDQSARLVWYHNHALGITRLNAYTGLASAYVIRDLDEATLIASGAIPSNEIPIVIQDKTFKSVADQWGQPGDLWYPSEYDPSDLGPFADPLPFPSCVPEFFGDTMLANGLVYPTAHVEQRKYRLRVLNACNARFCTLRLLYAKDTSFPGSTGGKPASTRPPVRADRG